MVTVQAEVWLDGAFHQAEIDCTVEPTIPARSSGHPDNRRPAEGGEVEVLEIRRVDTGEIYPELDPDDLERVMQDARIAYAVELEEDEAEWRAERGYARAEQREWARCW